MKVKSFLRIFSYTFGTVLLLCMCIIVTMNFIKDGRFFEKPAVVVAKDTSVKPLPVVIVKKNTDVKIKKSKKTSSDTSSLVNETKKMRVEIMNYTGDEKVGEDLKATLELNDFIVTLKNETATQGETLIVERSDRKAGEIIQGIMKVGSISVEIQKEPYFDAIINVGVDYSP